MSIHRIPIHRIPIHRIPLYAVSKRSFFTIIDTGIQAYRLTLGKSANLLEPGIHFNIPILHEVRKVDVREQIIDVPHLPAFTKDNVPISLSASLFFQVNDSYKCLFGVSNYMESVCSVGTSAARSIIGNHDYDDIIADRNKINQDLLKTIGPSILNWGITCTRFEIQSFKPSNKETEKQLELQMEAERNRRKQILDTQAAINVAGGMKEKSILESEGDAIATKNKANADAYKINTQTAVLCTQLEELIKRTGSADTAGQLLLALERNKVLNSIAEGTSNKVYFLPNDGIVPISQIFASITK